MLLYMLCPECYFRCYCIWCNVSRMLRCVTVLDAMHHECYFMCYCTLRHMSRMLLYVYLMSRVPNVTSRYSTWCHASRMLLYVLLYLMSRVAYVTLHYCTWCRVSLMLLYVLLSLMSCTPNVTLRVTLLEATWPVSLTSRPSLFIYWCTRTCLSTVMRPNIDTHTKYVELSATAAGKFT